MLKQVVLLTFVITLYGCGPQADTESPGATAAAPQVVVVTQVVEAAATEPVSIPAAEPGDAVAALPVGSVYPLGNTAEFTQLTESGRMALAVLCTSQMSVPCVDARELFAARAARTSDWVRFVHADLDTPEVAALQAQYSITVVPTLLMFTNGQPAGRVEGLYSANELSAYIDSLAE